MEEELKLKVEAALEEIRPFLQNDGGDISLVSIEDGKKSDRSITRRLRRLLGQPNDLKKRGGNDH